jgi:putative phage-type endonuclease
LNRSLWLEARKGGIGASDAASIIGLNPWKTNIQLWQEKTGEVESEDIGDKPVVKYGNDAEPLLRELFKLDFPQYSVGYDEFKMFMNHKHPFIFATLDGWIEGERKGVLEIKTTEIMSGSQWAKWKDGIPDNYYIQCLHQLIATGFDFVILKAQIKSNRYQGEDKIRIETKHYWIEKEDVLDDMDYLLEKEIAFWDQVKNKVKPALILPEI